MIVPLTLPPKRGETGREAGRKSAPLRLSENDGRKNNIEKERKYEL